MSEFLDSLRRYRRGFGVDWRDTARLSAHYVLFKAAWHSAYGRGLRRRAALALLRVFRGYGFSHEINGAGQARLRVPLRFHESDVQSFKEIFWGETYRGPLELGRCETLVDLGAGTGMASLFFLSQARLRRALLVEANPELARRLKETMQAQPCGTEIIVENILIAGRSGGAVAFHVYENHRDSGTEPVAGAVLRQTLNLERVGLGELLDRRGFSQVDLLKIDIEGAEFDLLANDPKVFTRFRWICAEIHGDQRKRDQFWKVLGELGFEVLERRAAAGLDCETSFARRR